MSGSEMLVGVVCAALTGVFFYQWYKRIANGFAAGRKAIRIALGLLPAAVFAVITFTLDRLASFDVDIGWGVFYVLIGYAWLYIGLLLLFAFFDLSWIDDALERDNPAAAVAVVGGGLGLTLIYAGANVGDGPGWWCVFFAGGLGLAAWVILGLLAKHCADVFKRITVGRDIPCAIRTCGWLLASGLILGRACAGDWTSFAQTVVEFGDGWPVLPLTAMFIGIELLILRAEKRQNGGRGIPMAASTALAAAFVGVAVMALYLLPPLPENPVYQQAAQPMYDWSTAW